jgi:hypothetical protein
MSVNTIVPAVGVNNMGLTSYADFRASALVRPKAAKGVSGFVFDIPSGEQTEFSSDVSEHYTESGSFINDHVVLKPIRITLGGFVGELIYEAPKKGSAEEALSSLSGKLSTVSAYLGPLTPGAIQQLSVLTAQAQYLAEQAKALAKRAKNIVAGLAGVDLSANRQAEAYYTIKALWATKQIVTVQTPWDYFDQMVIETVTTKQDENSNDITEFSVTLKQVRFVDIQTTDFKEDLFTPPVETQKAAASSAGPVQGAAKNQSVLYSLFGGGK